MPSNKLVKGQLLLAEAVASNIPSMVEAVIAAAKLVDKGSSYLTTLLQADNGLAFQRAISSNNSQILQLLFNTAASLEEEEILVPIFTHLVSQSSLLAQSISAGKSEVPTILLKSISKLPPAMHLETTSALLDQSKQWFTLTEAVRMGDHTSLTAIIESITSLNQYSWFVVALEACCKSLATATVNEDEKPAIIQCLGLVIAQSSSYSQHQATLVAKCLAHFDAKELLLQLLERSEKKPTYFPDKFIPKACLFAGYIALQTNNITLFKSVLHFLCQRQDGGEDLRYFLSCKLTGSSGRELYIKQDKLNNLYSGQYSLFAAAACVDDNNECSAATALIEAASWHDKKFATKTIKAEAQLPKLLLDEYPAGLYRHSVLVFLPSMLDKKWPLVNAMWQAAKHTTNDKGLLANQLLVAKFGNLKSHIIIVASRSEHFEGKSIDSDAQLQLGQQFTEELIMTSKIHDESGKFIKEVLLDMSTSNTETTFFGEVMKTYRQESECKNTGNWQRQRAANAQKCRLILSALNAMFDCDVGDIIFFNPVQAAATMKLFLQDKSQFKQQLLVLFGLLLRHNRANEHEIASNFSLLLRDHRETVQEGMNALQDQDDFISCLQFAPESVLPELLKIIQTKFTQQNKQRIIQKIMSEVCQTVQSVSPTNTTFELIERELQPIITAIYKNVTDRVARSFLTLIGKKAAQCHPGQTPVQSVNQWTQVQLADCQNEITLSLLRRNLITAISTMQDSSYEQGSLEFFRVCIQQVNKQDLKLPKDSPHLFAILTVMGLTQGHSLKFGEHGRLVALPLSGRANVQQNQTTLGQTSTTIPPRLEQDEFAWLLDDLVDRKVIDSAHKSARGTYKL